MTKDEILSSLFDLSVTDLQEVALRAHNLWWDKRAMALLDEHRMGLHRGRALEGCYGCLPMGERIGG